VALLITAQTERTCVRAAPLITAHMEAGRKHHVDES
jgi:hypothetical protein